MENSTAESTNKIGKPSNREHASEYTAQCAGFFLIYVSLFTVFVLSSKRTEETIILGSIFLISLGYVVYRSVFKAINSWLLYFEEKSSGN